MNILVLCHGNINRSPLCHAVLAYNGFDVKSAGFVNPGRRASKKMREAAKGFDLDLEGHRSQLITKELCEWAEIIVYMDGGNYKRLTAFLSENKVDTVQRAVVCLGNYAEPTVNRIPDPAFMNPASPEFPAVVKLIVSASTRLAQIAKGRQL